MKEPTQRKPHNFSIITKGDAVAYQGSVTHKTAREAAVGRKFVGLVTHAEVEIEVVFLVG